MALFQVSKIRLFGNRLYQNPNIILRMPQTKMPHHFLTNYFLKLAKP